MKKTIHIKTTPGAWGLLPLALLAVAAMSGCARDPMPTAPSAEAKPAPPMEVGDVPGVPVERKDDPNALKNLVASRSFSHRPDPFALFPAEVSFENSQSAENLFAQQGRGFGMLYEPKEEVIEEMTIEPQPYRRLAGILVGETVAAILIMEDGKSYIVRPGMKIPNSDWTVVSISTNPEQAILRRPGNRLPKEISVRLESPPSGMTPGNNAPANPGGRGNNPGGRQGLGGGGPGARGGPGGPEG